MSKQVFGAAQVNGPKKFRGFEFRKGRTYSEALRTLARGKGFQASLNVAEGKADNVSGLVRAVYITGVRFGKSRADVVADLVNKFGLPEAKAQAYWNQAQTRFLEYSGYQVSGRGRTGTLNPDTFEVTAYVPEPVSVPTVETEATAEPTAETEAA